MTGRKLAIFIAAAACALSVCACTGSADADKFKDMKKKMEQVTEDSQQKQEKAEETEKKNAVPQKEEAGETPEGEFAAAFADKDVENNGGLFVEVGNRVYFRVYNKRSLALTTMGKPYPSEVDELLSKIMYYDLDTDETCEFAEVGGFGDLYASVDGLLLADPARGTTTLIREDGSIEEDFLEGLIREVSSNGKDYSCADPGDDSDPAGGIPEGDEDRDRQPGEVYLSEGRYGDLMACSFNNGDVKVSPDYIFKPGKHDMFGSAIEGAVCFSDDSVFLIKADGDKSPEEGKWAYDLRKLTFECYRFDEDHLKNGNPQYTLLEELSSVGWSCGEIDYLDLEGTWQMKGAIVEGFQYDDFTDSAIVPRVDFKEDGSAEFYSVDAATGEKLSSDGMFIDADQKIEDGPDYAIHFEYGDDSNYPDIIGVCYLSGDRLGIYKRYHYDGNSIGWTMGSYYKVTE